MANELLDKPVTQDHPAANLDITQVAVNGAVDADAPMNNTGSVDSDQSVKIILVTDESKADEEYKVVGGMEKFVIHDEGEEELLGGEELGIGDDMNIKLRKPGVHEKFKLSPASLFVAYMLYYKPNPEGMGESIFYVVSGLRERLVQYMRKVEFYLCYSFATKQFFLWPVKVSNTNWYHWLKTQLQKPPEIFQNNAIRVEANQMLGRYQVKAYPNDADVVWPTKPMNELVTEAIGMENIISSSDHLIYKELTSGTELT